MLRLIILSILLTAYVECDDGYSIVLTSNSPVMRGAVGRFRAEALYMGQPAEGSFKYEWDETSIKQNKRIIETKSNIDTWNVTYPVNDYPPGPYVIQVVLSMYVFFGFYREVSSQRIIINLTDTLNGQLVLIQNNETIKNNIVSNATVLNQTIVLKQSDADYIRDKGTSIKSYWFVDCHFVGISDNLTFISSFNVSDIQHSIESIVVVGYDPITTIAPPTTTTSSPNVTTIKPNVTTTTVAPTTKSSKTPKKRSVEDSSHKPHTSFNITFPSICNNSIVPIGPNFTYGILKNDITVRAPISNISITGNNWLEHGDVLHLQVKCKGSSLFSYCVQFHQGKYNITGNETCLNPDISEKCEFPVNRYFIDSGIQTVIIVIYNDVGKIVNPVTVTVYEVQKQAQLSVIVIPVLFSAIAIILIIFGVAYYMQNRSRFIVEVADFDFGRNYADMEYMTFKERLVDAISNAFIRAPSRSSSEEPVWPPGKYGSMP